MTRLRSPFQGVAVLLAVVLSHISSASAQQPIFSPLQDNQLVPATELNPQNQATQAVENVFPQPIVDNHTNSGLDYYELPPAKDSSAEGMKDGGMKHDGMMESKSDDKKDEEETEEEGGDISDLSKRLEELEEKYSELSEANSELSEANSKLADASSAIKKSLKGYAKSGHSGATMKVNGRIHADLWGYPDSSAAANQLETGDPNTNVPDHFEFRRLRFGVKGDLPYNMLYKIEMEFAGGNDSEFRDAYFGWKELPVLGTLLLGNQKRPYGLDHLNSSRYNVFLERPFVVEGFNQDARRFGLVSYGVSDDQAWNWRYGIYNQRLIQDEGEYFGNNYQAQIAGRLANTIWYDENSDGRGYAHWAIAGTYANTAQGEDGSGLSNVNEAEFRTRPEARTDQRFLDTDNIIDGDDYTLFGLEGVLNLGAFQAVGEYQQVDLDRVNGSPDVRLHGGYCYLSYFLTGEHIPWDRKSGTLGRVKPFENFFLVDKCDGCKGRGMGAWQIAARYSYADFTNQDIFGGEGESFTLGVNWHWTPYSRMQFNYIYGRVDDADQDLNTGGFAGTGTVSGDYNILGARFMVDF